MQRRTSNGFPAQAGKPLGALSLQWDGETVPADAAELGVLAASLDCPGRDACTEAGADLSATGAGTVDLEVERAPWARGVSGARS